MEYTDVNLEDGLQLDGTPSYLTDYRTLYKQNPYEAALTWRFAANVGMAVNYGLHTVLGKGEHALHNGAMPLEQYRDLTKCLNAASFNAIDMVELCIASGARYLRFPAILPDGFCMFNSPDDNFHSVASAAQRDFVAEVASTCEFHGIGLVLEINLGNCGEETAARAQYVEHLYAQLHQLLTVYGPIAEVAFRNPGGIAIPELDMEDMYKYIRNFQNCTLISYGMEETGSADVLSAERMKLPDVLPQGKPVEMQYFVSHDKERGFMADLEHTPLECERLWEALKSAHASKASMLIHLPLNPDGSFNGADMAAMLDLGLKLETEGLR